jgi:hypothetical protein
MEVNVFSPMDVNLWCLKSPLLADQTRSLVVVQFRRFCVFPIRWRHRERSRFSGAARDLLVHNPFAREIPRPAGEGAGLRNDASPTIEFKLHH